MGIIYGVPWVSHMQVPWVSHMRVPWASHTGSIGLHIRRSPSGPLKSQTFLPSLSLGN